MANRHMKRCSTSLTSHLSEWPSSTNQQTTGVGENLEKGNPPALLVRLKLVRPLWETVWRVLKKLLMKLLCCTHSFSGYLSEEIPNTNSKRYMLPYVHCSVIYSIQEVKATQVPLSRLLDKVVVHEYSRLLLSRKKNNIFPFVTRRGDLEGVTLSEISQSEKDRYHMISLMYRSQRTK